MFDGERGFTLIEIAVVLAVIGVLAGILTPVVGNYVSEARISRAQADVKAIADAISRFERDLGRFPMFSSGSGLLQDSSGNLVRLQGPGNMPTESSATAWTAGSPTDGDCSSGCTSGALEGQLLTNSPTYPTASSLSKPFKWKGPYVDVQSDPWGNAYLVNIINAKSGSADSSFVLSAGPDGQVDTAFNISKTTAVAASDDDILYRIK